MEENPTNQENHHAPSNRTRKLRYVLAGAIAAVLLVVLFSVLFSKPSIDLNKYLRISVDGYNGYGTVTAEFDWDQLREDHQDDVKLSKTMETRLEGITSGETEGLADLIRDSVQPIDILEELVQFTMDTSGYVSNGDEIPYQFTVNESAKNILDVKLKYHDGTYKVSGLPEAEGLFHFSDLPEDFVQTVQKEAQDVIAKTYEISNLTYAGYALCLKKENVTSEDNNRLYIIYSGDVKNKNKEPGNSSTVTIYCPVFFDDIVLSTAGASYSSISQYYNTMDDWDCLINPLQAYSQIVTQNEENYFVETGGGFEVFQNRDSISKLEDIDQAYKDELIANANDYIQNKVDTWRKLIAIELEDSPENKELNVAYSDPAFVGEYFLTAKQQTDDYISSNAYIRVYTVTVTSLDGVVDPKTVYLPVEYDGIIALPNKRYTCLGQPELLGIDIIIARIDYASGGGHYIGIRGYIDGTRMFNDCIAKRQDQYNYQVSEGLKPISE